MAAFKNLKDLEKFLNQKIKKAMENEVAEKVRDIQQEKIDEEVYDVYNVVGGSHQEPYVYERRCDQGGLRDRRNMVADVKESNNGVELSVENITKAKDQSDINLVGLIEYGDDSQYGYYEYKTNRDGTSWQYRQPRPFLQETRNHLSKTGEHVEALKKGLKRQGIDVE
jgi:hypothetical protein